MRKVGSTGVEADSHLEDSLAGFQRHLDQCVLQFEGMVEGLGVSLQSGAARSVAQYSDVVSRLVSVRDREGEGKYLWALRDQVKETVIDIRDDVPEWKSLANATVLEVLERCVELGEDM